MAERRITGPVNHPGSPIGLIPIRSISVSNGASADFDGLFTPRFRKYVIFGSLINPVTSDVDIFVRTDANGGASYDSGATDYGSSFHGSQGITARVGGGNNAQGLMGLGSVVAGAGIRNGTNDSASFIMFVHEPLNTTYFTNMTFTMSYREFDTNWANVSGTIARGAAQADDSIQFFMESGNHDGEYEAYGIENI